jgi:regulator of sigma E protease
VREFGHFIVARRSGVKVERFSIGFGPVLFKRKGKETDFLICLFPLGGYVKMAGDAQGDFHGLGYEFLAKPIKTKIKIVFAGPLFNYIFAFILFWFITMFGMPQSYTEPVIGTFKENSTAQIAGVRKGDRIITVDGKKIESWEEAQQIIQKEKGIVKLTLKRGDTVLTLEVPSATEEALDELGIKKEVSGIGISPYIPPMIGKLKEGYPAKKIGIREGDKVLSVNGKKVDSWDEMIDLIHGSQNNVSLEIERLRQKLSLIVPVERIEIVDELGRKESISVIGIEVPSQVKIVKYNLFSGFLKAIESIFKLTFLIIKSFIVIVTHKIPFKNAIAGPIGIYFITSEAVKSGIVYVLHFTAVLSVSLAVINLIPLPLFDGGHIFFFLLEKIRKKPLSEEAEEHITRLGFIIIITLMLFVFYNDILRFGAKIWGK